MTFITILKDLYNKNGLKALIEKLEAILLVKLDINDYNSTITINDDHLTINDTHPISIYLEDGLVVVRTKYKTYEVLKYIYDGEIMRNVTLFNTPDDNLLVVDYYYNEDGFMSRRVSKTTKEDKYYNHGFVEREICGYPHLDIEARSHYSKTEEREQEERIVSYPDENLYYHHYDGGKGEQFVETAMVLEQPQPTQRMNGHIRIHDDLLPRLIKKSCPSIVIRGVVLEDNGEPKYHYETSFDLTRTGIIITDIITNYKTKEIIKNKQRGRSKFAYFAPELIVALMTSIEQQHLVTDDRMDVILNEFERLSDMAFIFEGEMVPEFNELDLAITSFDDPTYLAQDVYENLDTYNQMLDSENKKTQEKQPNLKPEK